MADILPGQADLNIVVDASAAPHVSGVFDQTVQVASHSTSGYDHYGIRTNPDDIHLDALLNVYDGTTFWRLATGVGPLYVEATGNVTPDRTNGLNWRGRPLERFSVVQREHLQAAKKKRYPIIFGKGTARFKANQQVGWVTLLALPIDSTGGSWVGAYP
jgi:hypothetical protein